MPVGSRGLYGGVQLVRKRLPVGVVDQWPEQPRPPDLGVELDPHQAYHDTILFGHDKALVHRRIERRQRLPDVIFPRPEEADVVFRLGVQTGDEGYDVIELGASNRKDA